MRDDYDRDDRRPRRARRDYDDRAYPARKETSVLAVVALVIGIKALLVSLIPCVGAFAILAAGFALLLSGLSVYVARGSRQGMGLPVAATVVSGAAVAISLVWVAVFGAMFGLPGDRAATRPAPPPPPPRVKPAPRALPTPAEPPVPVDEKQLLEDLAKDHIDEAIRFGPGLPATAADLDAAYRTNAAAAEAKYNNKVLEVTGAMVRVARANGDARYTLELEAGATPVACGFGAQARHALAALGRGQTVTVRGLCTGRAVGFVQLKDCVLVK